MDAVKYQGFTFTPETGQERCWILSRKPDPILAEELSKLDVRMMENNSIPHVLTLDLEQINSEAVLRYRMPVGRGLMQIFQSGQGNLKFLLGVLHSLAIILEDSRLYMLDKGKYALHPSLISVGEGIEDVCLIYLPLRTLEKKQSVTLLLGSVNLLFFFATGNELALYLCSDRTKSGADPTRGINYRFFDKSLFYKLYRLLSIINTL